MWWLLRYYGVIVVCHYPQKSVGGVLLSLDKA